MKKIICIILALLTLTMLFACNTEKDEESSSAIPSKPQSEAESQEESSSAPEHDPYTIACTSAYGELAKMLADSILTHSGIKSNINEVTNESECEDADVVIGIMPSAVEAPYAPLYHEDSGIFNSDNGKTVYIFGGSESACNRTLYEYIFENVTADGLKKAENALKFNDYPLKNAKINGTPLSEYSLIFADTNNEAKYEDIAILFKEYFKAEANIDLPVYDGTHPVEEHEIDFGVVTSRKKYYDYRTQSKFEYDEYRVLSAKSCLYIEGNNACGAWHGMNALIEEFVSAEDNNISDFELTGKVSLIKVACVGDSITQGNNSSNYYNTAYPVYLQRMLGYNYYVKNYGASGYSVVFDDEYSYSKHAMYKSAVDFAADVMIFMLGTNDGNPGQAYKAWEGTGREEKYYNDVNTYLDTFLEKNPDMQIFMCLPAPLFKQSTRWGDWAEWARRIETYVIPLNQRIAEERSLPIVDIHSWAVLHPEVFPDGLHPLEESYKDYAQRVYDEIKDVIVK